MLSLLRHVENAPIFTHMMTRGRGGAPRGKSGVLSAQSGAGGRGRSRGMSSDRGGGRGDRGGRGGDRGEFGEQVRNCRLGLGQFVILFLRSMLAVWEKWSLF